MKRFCSLLLVLFLVIGCTKSDELLIPNYKTKLYLGDTINLRAAAKNRVTLLTVWSIFCSPCLKELPEIQTLYDQYKNNQKILIVTLAVNTEEELSRFLSSNADKNNIYRKAFEHSGLTHFSLPVMIGMTSPYQVENGNAQISDTTTATRLKKLFNFDAIPVTRIYDRQGRLVFEQLGVETSVVGLRTHQLNLGRKLDSLVAL